MGLGVEVGADIGGVGSRNMGPLAKIQARLVREQYLANKKAHLWLCTLNSRVGGCDATSHFSEDKVLLE